MMAQRKMTRTQDQALKTGLALPGTRSRTRPPPFKGPETVDELDDDDDLLNETQEEGTSLSDLDKALSDGASLYGNESPLNAGLPNLQELVRLGQEHCRIELNTMITKLN